MSYLLIEPKLARSYGIQARTWKGSLMSDQVEDARRVAVVDDDPDFQALVCWHLKRIGFAAESISDTANIRSKLSAYQPSIILLDWQLGKIDGTTLIEELREEFPGASIVFTTAHATPELAARSIQLGAFDFLTKPIEEARLALTMERAEEHASLLQRLRAANDDLDSREFEDMVGGSPQMRTVFSTIRHVAQTDVNVMISGESGVGKELVANAIHTQSPRANGPFVAINMASLPENLVESQLFGHEKGAFTGADKAHAGAVHEANGGTLFLDEFTEMPIQLQAKLLRFLQEGTYRPLGSESDKTADVRIVSATNRDPLASVHDGILRQDVYYRLNVIPIEVPPLRERDGDIATLAIYFLRKYGLEHEKDFYDIDSRSLEILERYPWPGNVRELSHVLQRIVILNDAGELRPEHIPAEILDPVRPDENSAGATTEEEMVSPPPTPMTAQPDDSYNVIPLSQMEKEAIENALQAFDGSAHEAAQALGISRATIYRKIKLYKIGEEDGGH